MSSALVRQALAFVDPEEHNSKGKRRRGNSSRQQIIGQVSNHPFKKNKKPKQNTVKSKEKIAEENIKKLLALSAATADSATAEKIVERAVKGKPLADKIEVKTDEVKSILFPDESFDKSFEEFENSYFCS